MRRKNLIVFLFYLLLPLALFSQNSSVNSTSISLKDSVEYIGLKTKFSTLINPNPDSALIVIKALKQFIDKIDYPEGQTEYFYLKASYFRRLQNSDSAIFYFQKGIDLAEKIDYDGGKTMSYNGLCHVLSKVGKMTEAKEACEKCIVFAQKMANRDMEAASYLAIGQIFMRQNELKNGLIYNLKIDSMHQANPIRMVIVAAAYQNIGDVYLGLDELDLSEEYFLKSIGAYKELPMDVTYYLKHANWYLGQLYFKKKDYEKSDELLKDCHDYFSLIQDNHTLAEISKTLGLIQIEKQHDEEGAKYLQQAYDLQSEFGNRNERAYIGLELGKLYIKQKKLEQSIVVLDQALEDVPLLNNSEIMQEAHLMLGEAYNANNDYDKAIYHLEKGLIIKDSLQLIQSASQLREIEAKYQTENKEREIAFLKSEHDLAEHQRKNQRNVLLGGIGITSLATLFFFFLFRNRQKTNDKLKEIDHAKSTFFTNISHEFRTPLTLIKGPIQEQLKKTDLEPEVRAKFEMIDRNSDRLLNLVNQTLNISKIESGSFNLKVANGDLATFVGTLTDAFKYSIEEKGLTYIVQIDKNMDSVYFDNDVIEKVITNLLSNAIKNTNINGEIKCSTQLINDVFHLSVGYTGKGLSKENLDKVFDRLYQVNPSSDRVGVGLSLVHDLVTLHKGNIQVSSDHHSETTFKVEIPVSRSTYSENELALNQKIISKTILKEVDLNKGLNIDLVKGASKPILLIVEDNEDVRTFVRGIFKNDYTILEAVDGLAGVEIALEKVPDIIISDVMMPIKDGITLSQELKQNECTSHVPIILLTAKSGDENELLGVKSGADDYITKPFNIELLKAKVDKLIESRLKLRERYSQLEFLKPKDISFTPSDTALFERIQKILDEKMSDGNFSTESFSELVGMSRMQLHRKLKAITGLSATDFLRSQRLKTASYLLKSTDKNVSEIGYAVGFNDHAYFSKCFKDVYQCSPSEYRLNEQA